MHRWDAYEAFATVVERGSYTSAAEKLGISKSAVSRFISNLEDRLGSQLLYRTTRKLTPTDLGRSVYERCVAAFENLESIELEAMEHDSVPRGRFRIVAGDSFGDIWVAPLVADMANEYRELTVELLVSDRNIDIVGEGYDVAIRHDTQPDSALRAQKICSLPHTCAASPDYLAHAGIPETVEDLTEHNCLISSFEPCREWKFKTGPVPKRANLGSRLLMNSGQSLISAALRGVGIVWLPELYLREYINNGQLVELLAAYRGDAMPVWCVYPARRRGAAKVQIFINHLRKRMAAAGALV